jgi:signal transduction histidine kinase
MKRLDSLYLRVAAVLLLGLVAAQWVAQRLYEEERERVIAHLIAGPITQRLALVADKLEHTPAAERSGLLSVLNSPRIRFHLADKLPELVVMPRLAPLQTRLDAALGGEYRVRVGGGEAGGARPGPVRIAFTLKDGQIVVAEHHFLSDPELLPSRHLPLLTGYLLGIALLALLAMRWAVRPLRELAEAADALGRDLEGKPLSETGPREVRQAAHAFNTMQTRLASYLGDRLRILAAVSHDLKTPITRLKLRSEMLADAALKEKFLRDLDDMETMIAATLDFLRGESRQETGAQIDIDALLSTLADDMHALGGQVEIEGQTSRPLLARPQALKRCIGNLLDNAVRYGGGAVVKVEDGADALILHIEDDGPGVAPEELETLFEPFRRGEASRNRATGGTGLGLAIARNLARAHGGEVSLANRPQGGLCATLNLPRSI